MLDFSSLSQWITLVGFFGFVYMLGQRNTKNTLATKLSIQAAKKRIHRDQQRDKYHDTLTKSLVELGISSAHHSEIHNMNVEQIKKSYADGKFSVKQVITTMCARALALGSTLNSNAEECFHEAVSESVECDKIIHSSDYKWDESHETLLMGIPISVKDIFDQKGYDATCGLARRCFTPADADGLLVTLIRQAGGIPYVRTNVPQGLLLPESDSYVWGPCQNPWDPKRTAGGSSGGEAALIAAHGSVLGIGTDIGGSLRIPAHFCGITALKPSSSRISFHGVASPFVGDGGAQDVIRPVAGPMSRSVDDLTLIMRTWLCDEMWKKDIYLPKLPFNMNVYKSEKKLKIGYYTTDDWFETSATCSRAVTEAVAALTSQGHTCIPFIPPNVWEGVYLYMAVMTADAGQSSLLGFEGETPHTSYGTVLRDSTIPPLIRPFLPYIINMAGLGPRVAHLSQAVGKRDIMEFYAIITRVRLYQQAWADAWSSQQLDAVVCPSGSLPAYRHNTSRDLLPACSYTFLFNLLDFTAGVVPVTRVREDEQVYVSKYNDKFTVAAQETCKGSAGLPIGVQIITLPNQDELCLNIMSQLEKAIGFHDKPTIVDSLKLD